MRYILHALKWLVVLAIVLGLAFLIYASTKITKPFKTAGVEKNFRIESGSTMKQVARDLEKEGFVSNAFFFKLYVYFKKSGGKIQAGNYSLSPAMPITVIAKKLTEGEVVNSEVRLTVTEGWTEAEIAEALEIAGLGRARDFLSLTPAEFSKDFPFLGEVPRTYYVLEGYLFPDTYLFSKDDTPEDIAGKMIGNFDKKLTADLRQKIASESKTLRQIVILASIIEREVGRNVQKGTKLTPEELLKLEEERRLVASVFWNRLSAGFPMQSDATISYITGRRGSARATLEETKINSPYNTYKYVGLPPGPISNPSLDSIMAAIEPAQTDYLYFLTAPDGTAYFAKTLDEHNQNRAKYLD